MSKYKAHESETMCADSCIFWEVSSDTTGNEPHDFAKHGHVVYSSASASRRPASRTRPIDLAKKSGVRFATTSAGLRYHLQGGPPEAKGNQIGDLPASER